MFPVFIPFPSFLLKKVDWQCSKANRSSVIASNKRSLALAASLMEIWPARKLRDGKSSNILVYMRSGFNPSKKYAGQPRTLLQIGGTVRIAYL